MKYLTVIPRIPICAILLILMYIGTKAESLYDSIDEVLPGLPIEIVDKIIRKC